VIKCCCTGSIEDRSRNDARGVVGVSGGVQGTVGYTGDYRTAIDTRDRLFCYAGDQKISGVSNSEKVNSVFMCFVVIF
jgi:hypothetical protein